MYSVEAELPDIPYGRICAYLDDTDAHSLFIATGRFPLKKRFGAFSPLHPSSRFAALLWSAPPDCTAVVEGPEGHSVEFAVPVDGVSRLDYPGIYFTERVGVVTVPLTDAGIRTKLGAARVFSNTMPVRGSLPWKEGTTVSHSRNRRFADIPTIYSRPHGDETIFRGLTSPLLGCGGGIKVPIIDIIEGDDGRERSLVDLGPLGEVEHRFCFLPPIEPVGEISFHGFIYASSQYVVCARIETGNTSRDFLVLDSATATMTISDPDIDTRDIFDSYRAFLSQAASSEIENEQLSRVILTLVRFYLNRDASVTRDHVLDTLRRDLPPCLYDDDIGKILVRQLLLVARMPLSDAGVGLELKPVPKIIACNGNISLVMSPSGRLELRAALAPQEEYERVDGKRRPKLQGGRTTTLSDAR
jgi:hypothetical protein